MKLTTILLTVSILHVSAKGLSQTVTFAGKEVPMKKVFTAIESQTGYVVFCDATVLADTKPVTVDAKDQHLQDFLQVVLKGQSLDYTILKKTIFIKKQAVAPIAPAATAPAGHDVTIHVTDTAGIAIESASVHIKDGKQGGATNSRGDITLSNVEDDAILTVSSVGYATVNVDLRGRSSLNIVLRRSESPLDDVQILAYGKTTKRLSTGNVTTVSSKDIESQPVTNPLIALEGMVPGVVVTQYGGYPGSGLSVRIQGQISMSQGSDPLIVIDGVPYPMTVAVGGGNALDFLNTYDIANITVLKDADATSIYGSRAAAGAILVTTKKGTTGDTRVNVNYQTGFSKVPRGIPLMNTQQYLQMRRQAFISDGLTGPSVSDYDVNGVWDTTRYTDWQKVFYGGSAPFTSAQVSVSGGNNNTQFRLSGNYHKQGVLTPGDFNVQQGSADLNLTNTSLNRKLKTQLNMQFSVNQNHMPVTQGNIQLAPDAPSLYLPDGSINWARIPTGNGTDSVSTWYNLMAPYWNEQSKTNTNSFVGNIVESYQILHGLEIKGLFGYNYQNANNSIIYPSTLSQPEYVSSWQRETDYYLGNIKTWQLEPQIDYNRTWGKGQLKALAGATFNESTQFQQQVRGFGFATDASMYDIGAAQTWRSATYNASDYKYDAAFGQLNYNWDNKYIFDGNWRRDGSSRFGPANRFHDFWSVAGAWLFSEEKAVKSVLPFLSFGKLRGSYGTTGNDQIGDYRFLPTYTFNNPSVPYQASPSIRINGLPNPYLQWEETRKLSASIDLGFVKDRILFNANYYRNRSSNQLLGYPLPAVTGFTSITENFPATIQNSGWEFSLNTINLRNKDFQWNSSLTVTLARNKLISFPGLATSSFANRYVIGQPITVQHVFRCAGVDPATGLYQFYKNDGTLTDNPTPIYQANSDQTKLMDMTPDFYGGFQNTLRYKNWTLGMFFQFARQKQSIYFLYDDYPGNAFVNQPSVVLSSYWKQPGDKARFPRFSATFNIPNYFTSFYAYEASDGEISNASYIRLKNVSLSWEMPGEVFRKMGMKGSSLRLFTQAENLFVISPYPGVDPETGTTGIPPLRTITFGIEATL